MLRRLQRQIMVVLTAGLLAPAALVSAQSVVRDASFELEEDWRFMLVNDAGIEDPTDAFARANEPDFDDSEWRSVRIPHDWSIEFEPRADNGTNGGTGFLPGGLAWYRKHFVLPAGLADGTRVSVEFDGVYMDSYVYVNGELVGNHPYGYTGFAFDITDRVVADGETKNVIAVKVQNQLPSSRWYSGSGIYRKARLVLTDPVHVGRSGTYVTTPQLETLLEEGRAVVHIETAVVNSGGGDSPVRVVARVLDREGAGRASGESSLFLASGVIQGTEVDVEIDDPELWSPSDPALYTVVTEVYAGDRLVDVVQTRFGVRYVEFDPDAGLRLNGQPLKIQGVNMHHDLGALGSAVNRDALERQMRIMKSMGVNALRTAHNPPAPELVEVCEELGIMMMVEGFDMWEQSKTRFDYGRFFGEWSTQDISEMVLAARNSPAVVIWSIGNEIRGMSLETARRLVTSVRAMDDTRPVVMGSDGYRSLPSGGSTNDQILTVLDGLGVNYNTAMSVDALHETYPDKFFFESESSSSTSTRGVYQDPQQLNSGENQTPGKRAASSYDNNMASWTMPGEYGLKKDRDRQFFAGEFLWSGFDYIGEPTPFRQFPVKTSFFGAVDTAGFPKDLYWLFRSQWTREPMVHLLPMNWTDYRRGEPVEVWAYANVDTVELFLNGESLGVRRFDHKETLDGREYLETTEPTGDDKTFESGSYTSPNGSGGKLHLSWTVPFEPGALVAVARQDGVVVARDALQTAGPAYGLRLTPDRRIVVADGDSLAFVTVEVVDATGVVVPGAANAVEFEVVVGAIAGLDNGQQESAEGYQELRRSAFNGKALAILRSDGTAGELTLKATAPGLLPATVTIYELTEDAVVAVSGIAGAGPVHVRARAGQPPKLPAEVEVVFADGHVEPHAVTWEMPEAASQASQFVGTITAPDYTVQAIVDRYDVNDVETWQTSVPIGIPPMLPGTLHVRYTDGVSQDLAVDWADLAEVRLDQPGEIVLNGRIPELGIDVTADLSVTDQYEANRLLTGPESPVAATADASYSGSAMTLPERLVDGVISDENAWSNFYRKGATPLLPAISQAGARDWVSLSWDEPVVIDRLVAYFSLTDESALPAATRILFRDGDRFAPIDDAELSIDSDSGLTVIEFRSVATNAIRLEMTSAFPGTGRGFLRISELEAYGYGQAESTSAAFILGADISGVPESVDNGAIFIDTDGQEKDILSLLKNHGFNYIRLRTFVDPTAPFGYASDDRCPGKSEGYNDRDHIVEFAQAVKAAGMGLLLDFHYSDTWADPGKQVIPESWRSAASVDDLAAMVRAYTVDVMQALADADALPEIVQIGNEITPGLLIHVPTAETDCFGNRSVRNPEVNGSAQDWDNLATLLRAGIEGVKEVHPEATIMLHIENTADLDGIVEWVANAQSREVRFDVLGLSAYERWQGPSSEWQNTLGSLQKTFPDLRFSIVEYNPERRLINDILHQLPGNRGIGTFIWEPTRSGAWGQALFDTEGNVFTARPEDFAEFDGIAEDYGL